MKSMRKNLTVTLCLSQIVMLCGIANPVFSLPATSAALTEETQLASYEKVLFGQAALSGPTEARLAALEKNLFGQAKTGNVNVRLAAVGKALAGSKSDFLLPPMAPKFDFSQSHPTGGSGSKSSNYTPPTAASSGASSAAPEPSSPMNDAAKQSLREAAALYSQGRVDDAERAFKHVLTLDIRSTDAYFNLGVIAENRGDFQSALNNYQVASRINPDDPELRDAVTAVQGKIAQKIAADDRAKAQQQQALELSRGQQQHDNLKQIAADAQAAYKAGNYDRAVANLRMVAQQAPNDPDVQYALAQAYKGKGDLRSSRGCLERALSIDPNNRLYQTAMSQLNSRSGPPNSASGAPSPGSNVSNSYADDPGAAQRRVPYTPYNSPTASSSSSQAGWQSTAPEDNAPSGQLTPFTAQGESSLPGGGVHRGGVAGSGASGFFMGTGGGYGTKTRLTRAAVGAGAGLAFGAMFGASSHRMGRSMMTGALLGGALGLLSGGGGGGGGGNRGF